MAVSRELIEGADGELYIVEGNPTTGYHLFHASLEHVDQFRRKWQAVEATRDTPLTIADAGA